MQNLILWSQPNDENVSKNPRASPGTWWMTTRELGPKQQRLLSVTHYYQGIKSCRDHVDDPEEDSENVIWKARVAQRQPQRSSWKDGPQYQLQCVQTWWRPTGNVWPLSLSTMAILQTIELNFCYWPNTYFTWEFRISLKILQCDLLDFFPPHSVSRSWHVPLMEIIDICHYLATNCASGRTKYFFAPL